MTYKVGGGLLLLALSDWAVPFSPAGEEEAGPQKARLGAGSSARLAWKESLGQKSFGR